MAVTHLKPGTIDPIHYWQNKNGKVLLLSHSDMLGMDRLRRYMDRLGYRLMVAETLKEAESLQTKLQDQLKKEQEQDLIRDEAMTANRRGQIKERLEARKNSAITNEYEKEFIRLY